MQKKKMGRDDQVGGGERWSEVGELGGFES